MSTSIHPYIVPPYILPPYIINTPPFVCVSEREIAQSSHTYLSSLIHPLTFLIHPPSKQALLASAREQLSDAVKERDSQMNALAKVL